MENIIATRRFHTPYGTEVVISVSRPRPRDDASGHYVAAVAVAGLDTPHLHDCPGVDSVQALSAALLMVDTFTLISLTHPPTTTPAPPEAPAAPDSPAGSDATEPVASRRYRDPEGNEVVLSIGCPRPAPEDPAFFGADVSMDGPREQDRTPLLIAADGVGALLNAFMAMDALVLRHSLSYPHTKPMP